MTSYPNLKRWLSAGLTLGVLATVLALVIGNHRVSEAEDKANTAEQSAGMKTWPLWGGTVQRNMVNLTEKDPPTEWDAQNGTNIKWSADLGSKAYGGPTIADGKVFIGTNNGGPRNKRDTENGKPVDKGILMCFRESDGQFLWQAVHDKLPAGRVWDWPDEGICSTPFVEGKRVYYVSNQCQVVCADTEGFLDGKNDGFQGEKYQTKTDADILWQLDMMKALDVYPHNLAVCSPLIVGDTLFCVTANGVDEGHINIPKPAAPSFIAVNKNTGKVIWTSNLPSIEYQNAIKAGADPQDLLKRLVDQGKVLMHGQWSNPVYAEAEGRAMVIFPGGDGWIRAFDPANGTLLWKFDCNPKDAHYELGPRGTRSDFLGTPVVWENKLYIGTGQDPEHNEGVGHFWCIDITKKPANKDLDLSPKDKSFDPKSPENKDSALVWHFGGFAPKGAPRKYVFGRTLSTAAVHDGLCYIAEELGIIHCLDARTGKEYWSDDLGADTWASPMWIDGKIYMGSDADKIVIYEHGKRKKILKEIEMDGHIRATPVMANGVLYVMTENKLYAIAKKK